MDKYYVKFGKLMIVISVSIAIYFVGKYTFVYLYPFIIAGTIAYMLHPIVSYFEVKWRLNRTFTVFTIIFTGFLTFFTCVYFLLKQLIVETTELIEKLPIYFQKLSVVTNEMYIHILPHYNRIATVFPFLKPIEHLNRPSFELIFEQLTQSSTTIFGEIMTVITNIFSSLTYMATIFIFILLFVFILTKDMKEVILFYKKVTPIKLHLKIVQVKAELKKTILGFIRAQLIITFITTIIVMIGLFTFRVEHVITTSIIIFIVDFIPYIGVGIIFIPWMLYAFFLGNYIFTIQLAVLYMIVIIVRQFIEPKILATSLRIHPLVALATLFIAIQSLGLIGIFLSPMILIVLSALYHARVFHFIWYFVKN